MNFAIRSFVKLSRNNICIPGTYSIKTALGRNSSFMNMLLWLKSLDTAIELRDKRLLEQALFFQSTVGRNLADVDVGFTKSRAVTADNRFRVDSELMLIKVVFNNEPEKYEAKDKEKIT